MPTVADGGTTGRQVDIDAVFAKLSAMGHAFGYWVLLLASAATAFTMAALAPIARTTSGRITLIAIGVVAASITLTIPERRTRQASASQLVQRNEERAALEAATQRADELHLSVDLEHQLAVDIQTRLNVAMRDHLAPNIAAVHELIAATPQQRSADSGALCQKLITTAVVLAGASQVRGAFYAVEQRGANRTVQTLTRKAWTGRGDEPRKTVDRRGSALERGILEFLQDPEQVSQVIGNVHDGPRNGQYAGKRYRSVVALKVKTCDGKCVGMLAVDSPEADAFLEGELEALYPLAELFGIVQTLTS